MLTINARYLPASVGRSPGLGALRWSTCLIRQSGRWVESPYLLLTPPADEAVDSK